MADAGRHEQAGEIRGLVGTSRLLLDSLVIVDRSFWGDELVGPAVPQDRLAAAIAEGSQVRIVGSDDDSELLHRLIKETLVAGGRNRGPLELWILCEEISEIVQGYPKGLG